MKVFADELNRLIAERGWRNADLAREFPAAARDAGLEPCKPPPETTISRWRSGERRPGAYYAQVLCRLFNRSPSEFGLVDDIPFDGPASDADLEEAIALRALVEGTDSRGAAVSDMEAATLRLRRAYSRTPPDALGRQLRARLGAVRQLLGTSPTTSQRRDLMSSAGWLALLLGTTLHDRDQIEPAWAYRDVALQIGQELGHSELTAWTWETAAWFALAGDSYRDAITYAQTAQRLSPPSSSCLVAVYLQEARSWSRLSASSETVTAIRNAGAALEPLPDPAHLDDHYVFDPAKFSFYAATAYMLVGRGDLAEQHAHQVIASSGDPSQPNYWPGRVGHAHADLGFALAQRGEIDAAAHEGIEAVSVRLTHNATVRRARELLVALSHHRDVALVRDFYERYRAAAGHSEE